MGSIFAIVPRNGEKENPGKLGPKKVPQRRAYVTSVLPKKFVKFAPKRGILESFEYFWEFSSILEKVSNSFGNFPTY